MCETEPGCRRCSYQRRQIRKMRKAFAAIECALTHKCEHATEFIIGECESYRGKYEPKC